MRRFRFNYQTATSVYARVIVLALRARWAFSFAPHNMRGMERREAHLLFVSLPAFACEANGDPEAHRLTALRRQVYAVCASLTAIWRRFWA